VLASKHSGGGLGDGGGEGGRGGPEGVGGEGADLLSSCTLYFALSSLICLLSLGGAGDAVGHPVAGGGDICTGVRVSSFQNWVWDNSLESGKHLARNGLRPSPVAGFCRHCDAKHACQDAGTHETHE
jgi:hypothetical protein